jgi:hypothetical protein
MMIVHVFKSGLRRRSAILLMLMLMLMLVLIGQFSLHSPSAMDQDQITMYSNVPGYCVWTAVAVISQASISSKISPTNMRYHH